jgi:hypothetical protein
MIIVVARYNEDISWTDQFQNVVIYNKGAPLNRPNVIPLPNVGREPHTYYKYICDNYHNLDDYTVFLQGHPFDHSRHIIQDVKNLTTFKGDFEFLSECILTVTLENEARAHYPCRNGLATYYRVFGIRPRPNKMYTFGAGAQFIVSKKNILKRPKSFYLKIIEILQHDINPIEGFVIERFHKLVFE